MFITTNLHQLKYHNSGYNQHAHSALDYGNMEINFEVIATYEKFTREQTAQNEASTLPINGKQSFENMVI